ncbi:ComEA family DNA-binding protein [Pedobacter sp.]|uniref:ComEA family DNA-binding protein n=1 Tax=Pedobacter sp. TaxID=1411316 RepID=UPI003D7F60C1
MKKWLTNYFDLTKGEFNGLMVLVLLIFMVSGFPTVYNWLWPVPIDLKLERRAEAYFRKLALDKQHAPAFERERKPFKVVVSEKRPLRLHRFDPNTTSLSGWQDLGFSLKQAQSILKYRQKGGQFRKAEDLQNMYVVSPEVYQRLRPYIAIVAPHETKVQLPYSEVNYRSPQHPVSVMPNPLVDINRADTSVLESIRGIGRVFARRIIKYRERIGGFHKKEQLMEVYGLDLVKFEEIKDQVLVDASVVKRLNVNSIRVEDVKNNPYIRYKQVNAIIQYREQHGNYSNFDDLKKVIILTPEVLEQLSPYISFTP